MKYLLLIIFLLGAPRLMWAEESDQVPSSAPVSIITKRFVRDCETPR